MSKNKNVCLTCYFSIHGKCKAQKGDYCKLLKQNF